MNSIKTVKNMTAPKAMRRLKVIDTNIDNDLRVVEGSALDLRSTNHPLIPIEEGEYVTVNPDTGKFMVNGQRIRFRMVTRIFAGGNRSSVDDTCWMLSKQDTDLFINQMLIQGYNAIRFHIYESGLMHTNYSKNELNGMTDPYGDSNNYAGGASNGSDIGDFDLNPVALDRFYYLISKLRQNNIRIFSDTAGSTAMMMGGIKTTYDYHRTPQTKRWKDSEKSFKYRIFFDDGTGPSDGIPSSMPEVGDDDDALNDKLILRHASIDTKAHWRKGVDLIFNSVNPYTGKTLLEDEALVYLSGYNENGLAFALQYGYGDGNEDHARNYNHFVDSFNAWSALSINGGHPPVTRDAMPIINSSGHGVVHERILRYMRMLEENLTVYMKDELASMGYTRLFGNYNNTNSIATFIARDKNDVTEQHFYPDLGGVSDDVTLLKGNSSLFSIHRHFDPLSSLINLSLTNAEAKPTVITEYSHTFHSQHRYEEGVTCTALASIQDWDGMLQFANNLNIFDFRNSTGAQRGTGMLSTNNSLCPISRASALMQYFVWYRGDLPASLPENTVTFEVEADHNNPGYVFNPTNTPNYDQLYWRATRASYFGKIQLRILNDGVGNNNINLASLRNQGVVKNITDTSSSSYLHTTLAHMYGAGTGNASYRNTDDDIYAEINFGFDGFNSKAYTIDKRTGIIKINTPKTQAVNFSLPLNMHNKVDVGNGEFEYEFTDLKFPDVNLQHVSVSQMATAGMVSVSTLTDDPINTSNRLIFIIATDAINHGQRFQHNDGNGNVVRDYSELRQDIHRSRQHTRAELADGSDSYVPIYIATTSVRISVENSNPNLTCYALNHNGSRKDDPITQTYINGKYIIDINTEELVSPTVFFELI